jgi:glycerophosphoryl diester phosphodiesterase
MTPPLVIAHRGASLVAPENTLSAFAKAQELGADGVELDIHPTQDGILVVTHDEHTHRLTGVPGRINKMALVELKKLDFGSHFSSQFRGEKIPTLEEVFELLKGRMWIDVEIKSLNVRDDGREKLLVDLIRKWNMADQIEVSSFNIFALRRMAKLAPEIRRGYLFYEKQFGPSRRGGWAFYVKPYSFNVSHALLREGMVKQIRERGYKCWVWTVNEENQMRHLVLEGVDAIITDDPSKLIRLLSSPISQSQPFPPAVEEKPVQA